MRLQINHKSNFRLISKLAAPYSEAANLDQPGDFKDRPDQQLLSSCVEQDTVIAHQNGRRKLSGAPAQDQIEGQARLARAGGTADQHRATADLHGGGVDAALRGHGPTHGAGSMTTKRAPAIVGSPSSPIGPGRFSAQMRPP